jgi:hypothetical protein
MFNRDGRTLELKRLPNRHGIHEAVEAVEEVIQEVVAEAEVTITVILVVIRATGATQVRATKDKIQMPLYLVERLQPSKITQSNNHLRQKAGHKVCQVKVKTRTRGAGCNESGIDGCMCGIRH